MGSKDHSFDIASEVNMQEVDNAVTQAKKELDQRFDFKGSDSGIELDRAAKTILLRTENDYKLKALTDMLNSKCAKRGVSLKALQYGKVESGAVGGSVRQTITIQNGIPQDKAKEIVKFIKETKLKVQPMIQSDQVRVQAPKIDDLQEVMALLRKHDFTVDLQFINYR